MTKPVEDLDAQGDRIEHDGRRLAVLEVHELPDHAEVVAYSLVSGVQETVKFSRHEQVEVFH